ncbi:HET-domain-containing protein, partial [Massarina eburnea CBS 473.64]
MYLLNTSTLKLKSFLEDIPPYVILSHTWGDGEVTFDDIDQPRAKEMKGYSKITGCCKQAVLDGFEWVWIDTCCIDKRSSSDLSEAINSMYAWYWRAEICYVHLSDVYTDERDYETHQTSLWMKIAYFESLLLRYDTTIIHNARWFTRGWTLQELLASQYMEFYNAEWKYLGTKSSLIDDIERATNIRKTFLRDREKIKYAPIATKFSWASMRNTTRPEDIAYCLLGLVDVNMPMLYGEGKKAFYRLQIELLKKTNEHTIFAWGLRDWAVDNKGILSNSPRVFHGHDCLQTTEGSGTHEVTNGGLRIRLKCVKREGLYIATLHCLKYDYKRRRLHGIGIWLRHVRDAYFERV